MKGQRDLRWIKKGSIESKIKEKIETKCLKTVKIYILVKIRPTLGAIFSGAKCDRDKLIFMQKEKVNQIVMRY